MIKAPRIRRTREDWPFQPWPEPRGNTATRWEVEGRRTVTLTSRTALRRWLLLGVVVPMLLVGLAGVAVAHRHAGGQIPAQERFSQSACADRDIAELVREHRRVVRGL